MNAFGFWIGFEGSFDSLSIQKQISVWTYIFFRYLHCDTGSECIWLWQISSETVLIHWAVLDGGQHGDDNIKHSVTCAALWLAHHAIPAGSYNNSKCLKLLVIRTWLWENIQNYYFLYSTVVCVHHLPDEQESNGQHFCTVFERFWVQILGHRLAGLTYDFCGFSSPIPGKW